MSLVRVIQTLVPRTPWRWVAAAALLLGPGPATAHAQPVIVLDYSLDTQGFFGSVGSPQRIALETAATTLTTRLSDSLAAITPSGSLTWTAIPFHPGMGYNPTTGQTLDVEIPNLPVAQNVIRVYAGGQSLGGPLGIGGPGAWSASGNQAWFDAIEGRGQPGAIGPQGSRTDFAPWGGSITFDTATNWNFSVSNPPSGGQSDFLSVALHELGHVLGYGTADSWFNQINVSTGRFTGPVSTSLNGGVNPPLADSGHWADGTTYQGQPVAMDPTLTVGTRVRFTELDFGGLDDIGWQVTPVPEPETVLGVAALGLTGVWSLRRRQAARV